MLRKYVVLITLCFSLLFALPAFADDNFVDAAITIEEVLDLTLQNHVAQPDLDTLVNGAIEGIFNILNDPHSEYLNKESLEEFSNSLEGDYVGIGVSIQMQGDYPVIVEIFKNSPAERAGLKVGDLIVAVDGKSTYQESLSVVSMQIRGQKGTAVTLTVKRGEREFSSKLTRSVVDIPTVEAELLHNDIGYIDINSFGSNTALEFSAALKSLRSQGASAFILDLRDEPGGYLMAAVRMAGEFLPSGTKVVALVDRNGEEEFYRTFGTGWAAEMPVVILVNSNTASAAEILSGALKDYGVATLVGSQTYGKGTVQAIYNLSNGGALKLTVAKYKLPKGEFIDGVGIDPDRPVLTPGAELYAAQKLLKPTVKYTLQYTVGKNSVNVNGQELPLMSSSVLQKNNTYYLPLRATMEIFGYEVNWDVKGNGIIINNGKQQKFISSSESIMIDGLSYISVEDLTKLGFKCSVQPQVITVSEH